MLGDLFFQEDDANELSDAADTSTTHMKYRKLNRPPARRSEFGFVGLENQGATCYLNSLLQAMYMTPELREGIFNLDPKELGADISEREELEKLNQEQRRQQGDVKSVEQSIEPDDNLLSMLMNMGVPEHHAKRALIGTKNGSLDEVFVYIESHENDPDFNKPLEEDDGAAAGATADAQSPNIKKKKRPRQIPIELQRLFSQLQLSDRFAISTNDLTTKGFQWQGFDGQVQHDAHELNRLLIDALERSLKRTSGESLCQRLYEGTSANQITCSGCRTLSEREEAFYDINLQVIDCVDIIESLRVYTAAQLLASDSAYQCDKCGKKQSALFSTVIRKLPPILTFSCSRFKIDKSTNWQRVKVVTSTEFPIMLDMSAFSEEETRVDMTNNRFADLFESNGMSSNAFEIRTHSSLSDIDVNSVRSENAVWLNQLQQAAGDAAAQLIDNHGIDVCLDHLPTDQQQAILKTLLPNTFHQIFSAEHAIDRKMQNSLYQLHAVIMHRGSAHSGHYFAYLRDVLAEGKWVPPPPPEKKLVDLVPDLQNAGESNGANKETLHTTVADAANEQDVDTQLQYEIISHEHVENNVLVAGEEVGMIYIEDSSALALLVDIILEKETKLRKKSKKKSFSWRLNSIGQAIGDRLKNSWANVYKTKCGALGSFIRAQADLFRFINKEEFELIPSQNMIKFISSDTYEKVQYRLKNMISSVEKNTPVESSERSFEHQSSSSHQSAVYGLSEEEQLARAIEASLMIESSTAEQDAVVAQDSDDWQVAGGKKKPKRTVAQQQNEIPSITACGDNAKQQQVERELSEYEKAVCNLTIVLMNRICGRFFEFNDSTVTPMPVSNLSKAFSGLDSAYLLVYRRMQSSHESGGSSQPPLYWSERIIAENEALNQQRAEFDKAIRSIHLNLFCPTDFDFEDPLLIPKRSKVDETENIIKMSELEIDGTLPISELWSTFKSKHIASNDKFSALDLTIDGVAVALESGDTSQTNSEGDRSPTISALRKAGIGYYIDASKLVDCKQRICDVFEEGECILLWNGHSIGETRIDLNDYSHHPIRIKILPLEVPQQLPHLGQALQQVYKKLRGGQVPYVVPAKEAKELWIRSSSSLFELAKRISEVTGIAFDSLNISIATDISSVEGAGNGKLSKVTVLFNKSKVSGKVLNAFTDKSSASAINTYQAQYFLSAEARVGDFPAGLLQELLVENEEAKGLFSRSLAEYYNEQQNEAWSINFELDFIPKASDSPDDDSNAQLEYSMCPQQVAVPKFIAVYDLKIIALTSFGLVPAHAYMNECCFYIGTSEDGSALSDEEISLIEAGIKPGMRLRLARGSSMTADEMLLKVALVNGNSHKQKYSTSEAGEQVAEIELLVHADSTIESIRSRAGETLCGYSSDWVEISSHNMNVMDVSSLIYTNEGISLSNLEAKDNIETSDVILEQEKNKVDETSSESELTAVANLSSSEVKEQQQERRLRRTTWLKEPAELLTEMEERIVVAASDKARKIKIGDVEVDVHMRTVKDCGLKSGDTILLEEGPLPNLRGQLSIQVYSWKEEEGVELDDNSGDEMVSSKSMEACMELATAGIEKSNRMRRSCLKPAGRIEIHERSTLNDLQSMVFRLLTYQCEQKELEKDVTSADQFVLRELRADLLPGRSFWTCPATASSTGSSRQVNLAGIGMQQSTSRKKKQSTNSSTGAGQGSTLKALKLRAERGLVVEFLLAEQKTVRPPPGAFRIWVQRLQNPGAPEGCALMTPIWPPKQVLVNGGDAPSIGHLKRSISTCFTDIPLESMRIFKYRPQSIDWVDLVALSNSSTAAAIGKKKKAGRPDNITQGPFHVKEGDQFCVFDNSSVIRSDKVPKEYTKESHDALRAAHLATTSGLPITMNPITENDISVALPDDVFLRILREAEKAMKKASKQTHQLSMPWMGGVAGSSASGQKPSTRSTEIALSLGRGFDFDFDEEDQTAVS